MNEEEIREKAAALAELYAAKAAGKTLQFRIALDGPKQWIDHVDGSGPNLASASCDWRVKPEPQRMWEVEYTKARTESEDTAKKWRAAGYTVTEWQEVLPE